MNILLLFAAGSPPTPFSFHRTASTGILKGLFLPLLFLLIAFSVDAQIVYAKELNGKDFKEGFKLEWSTILEKGSEIFVIERSDNGVDYSDLGSIKAAGYSDTQINYVFEDLQLGLEAAYYRIRQINTDGASERTNSIWLEKFAPVNYTISGIEHSGRSFSVFLDSVIEGELSCSIQNLQGEEVYTNSFLLQAGLNEYQLNLDDELPGQYSLIFKLGSEILMSSLVVPKDSEREKDRLSRRGNTKKG